MGHVDEAARPRAEQFLRWVGTAVTIDGTDTVLMLDEVAEHDDAPPGFPEGFTLILAAAVDAGSVLAEGLYRCRFDDGPALDIHVMPIDAGGGPRQLYQAVFN